MQFGDGYYSQYDLCSCEENGEKKADWHIAEDIRNRDYKIDRFKTVSFMKSITIRLYKYNKR
jgi:hypothetical protein